MRNQIQKLIAEQKQYVERSLKWVQAMEKVLELMDTVPDLEASLLALEEVHISDLYEAGKTQSIE